jgi:outer membrane protein assembly factor BamB
MPHPKLRAVLCVVVWSWTGLPTLGQQHETAASEKLLDVRVVLDEADAVLDLLAKRARGQRPTETDWQRLEATEGYRRLKQRQKSFGAESFDSGFRDWVRRVDLTDLERLRSGVNRWRTLDVTTAGRVAHAYLPEGTPLRATIYPVLKRTQNSFVFEVDTDPAIFMYVSGEASESELANTLAHELHHIGSSAGCPNAAADRPPGPVGDILRWMGAFAEGLAVLAAAGGPSVHPHAGRAAEEWIVWERDVARFNEDLPRIERFFLDILSGELDAEAQRPRFFELIRHGDTVPQGPFYTVGWKMGALVEQRFGRQAVIDAICDMPRLLVAYNQIAYENPRDEEGSLAVWSAELLRAIGAPDVIGTWRARPEHNGQRGDFVIRFELDEEGGLRSVVSLPPLDAWNVVTLPVKLEEDRIEVGSWVLQRQVDGGLSGELPAWLVPVHRIAVTLHRSTSIEPPVAQPVEAPLAEPVWTRDLGSPIWAGISTGRGNVYVGDDAGRLTALDAYTGAIEWQFETGGAIRARTTVTEEALLVHSDDGFLYALAPDSGDVVWRAAVASAPIERIPLGAEGARYNHYASAGLLVDDTVYVGGFDGRLYALAAGSGVERWQFEAGDTIAGTPAAAAGQIFFGSFDGHVYALDATSGEELWRYDTGAPVVSSPLVHDGRVLVGSRSYDLLALDAATGELDWAYYYWFSWVESSAVERGGTAYVGSSDGQLVVALDAADGRERWRFDSGGSAWSQPAVTDSTVYIGTVGVADYMVAHQADLLALGRTSGEPLWHYPLSRPGSAGHWGFAAAVAVDETMVFAAGLDGLVRAFRQDP